MHGKIVEYSYTTGNGTIINGSKKLFNFKLTNWHDSTQLPEARMLVEFRVDEDTNDVVDLKSSKYQEFGEDSIIKERDFWKTNSDSDLEKLESDTFEEIISQTYKSTDYTKITSIATSISIEKFVEYHFENEAKLIKYSYKLPTNGQEKLNYLIVYKFIKRVLDALINTDRRFTKDTFSMYLQIIGKLEYLLTPFYKAEQKTEKVFKEGFLAQQLYYNAAQRKLLNTKDDLLKLEGRKRNLKSDLYTLNIKLNADSTKNKQEVKDKIIKLQKQSEECSRDLKIAQEVKEKVTKALDEFMEIYEKKFAEYFEKTKEQIFEHIRNSLNIAVTSLDNKLWELGMASEPIKNHFFKLPSGYSFCALAFMQQYMKTLDVGKLNDGDRLLHIYINKYRERNTQRILIVSNHVAFEQNLRIEILKTYKNSFVSTTSKKMEYLIIVQNEKFDYIIIDNNMKEDKPIEMIIQGKSSKHNKNATFILYQSPL